MEQQHSGRSKYYGKYRGTVVNNVDPMQIGRIQVIVPDVSNVVPTSWAMPCLPGAGINTGLFTVPQIGSGVWVEFEQGDPDRPIWVGGYWGTAAEVPVLAHMVPPAVNGFTLQTTLKNGIVVSRRPGADGWDPDPDDDRRDDLGQRRRHHDLERQGRGHLDARADDRRQRGSPDGRLMRGLAVSHNAHVRGTVPRACPLRLCRGDSPSGVSVAPLSEGLSRGHGLDGPGWRRA